nr:MAG TPA: hypothetical protein [Caudoviricetes sp.]
MSYIFSTSLSPARPPVLLKIYNRPNANLKTLFAA